MSYLRNRPSLRLLTLCAALVLGAASAQQGGTTPSGQNQPRQLDPAQRARFQAMQPVLDLAGRVSLLSELEKTPATAVTKAQAKQLLPLLQKLTTATSITPADATKTLTQLEDKILSDKQVTALDDLDLKRQEERRALRAKSGGSAQGGGLRIPGVPVRIGAQGQNRPAGQAQGGQQAGQRPGGFGSGPFNPFKQGRQADALKKYIAVLQKK